MSSDRADAIADQIRDMLKSETTMVVSYLNEGQVVSKAMYIACHKDFLEIWVNTDLTSDMVAKLNNNDLFSLYLFDNVNIRGLLLQAKASIETDHDIIRQCFKEDMASWYDGGIESRDYVVIKFTIINLRYFANSTETCLEIERQ